MQGGLRVLHSFVLQGPGLSAAWQEPGTLLSSVPLIRLICLLLLSLQIYGGQGFSLAFIQAVLHGALIRTVSLVW